MDKFENKNTLNKTDCSVVIDAIFSTAADYIGANGPINLLPDIYQAETIDGHTIGSMIDTLIMNAWNIRTQQDRPFPDSECEAFYGLSTTNDHTGKMSGNAGMSTNNKINDFCTAHKNCPGSICKDCFANAQLDFMTSMNKPLTINFLLLNYALIPANILPIVNRQFYRIESFGDVATITQARNYIHLMTANKLNERCNFGAWSKNPGLWVDAFRIDGKPHNLSFGISSLYKDKIADIPAAWKIYANFVFTVWTSGETARAHGVTINCGKRHCLTCLACYTAHIVNEPGKIVYIHELLK